MLETIFGGIMGGLFRLAPEILKWIDRRGERSHELALRDADWQSVKLLGDQKQSEIVENAKSSHDHDALVALQNSITAQGRATTVKWADAISSTVRPIVTYWFMAVYCGVKISALAAMAKSGMEWSAIFDRLWTGNDQELFAAIMNFWFLGRVFDKKNK